MAYMGVINNGYQFFDEDHQFLFATDKEHSHLFDYIASELSCLSDLFEQYFSAQIDMNTLKLNSQQSNTVEIIGKLEKVLLSAHPYYCYENKANLSIIKECGRFFNELLTYLHVKEGHDFYDLESFDEWYKERIYRLLCPLTTNWEDYEEGFRKEYQECVAEGPYAPKPPIEATLLSDIPDKPPVGFINEIEMQKEISNMLYFILDISVPELERLTAFQRSWMYGNILYDVSRAKTTKELLRAFNNKDRFGDQLLDVPLMKVSQVWSLAPAHRYYVGNCGQRQEHIENLYGTFRPLYALNHVNLGQDGIPADLKNQMAAAIKLAATQETNPIYVEYEVDDLRQLTYLEVLTMIQADIMVKKCKFCGKYFVTTNRNTAYCNRIDDDGICCSVAGPQQTFQKKLGTDEALKVYNRAYRAHYARVRKGAMREEDFRMWYSEAREKLEQARDGKLDIDSFQKWLKI